MYLILHIDIKEKSVKKKEEERSLMINSLQTELEQEKKMITKLEKNLKGIKEYKML